MNIAPAASIALTATRRPPWQIAGWMILLSVTSYVSRTVMSIAGPDIIQEFGLSETQMGTVYSAFLLSYALLLAPGGRLADRFGPRATLTLTTLGIALLTALTPLAGNATFAALFGALPLLLGIRFLLGVFTAPLYPGCANLTGNWFAAERRARVQGFVIAGAPLGGAITPLVVTKLIQWYGWRGSFFLVAGLIVFIAAGWFWFVRNAPAEPRVATTTGPKTKANAWRRLLTNRNLIWLALGYFAVNYFEYIFFYWIYYYFGEIRGLGREQSAIYTTILLLAMMAGMPIGGWIADRLIPRRGAMNARRIVSVIGMSLSAVLLVLGTNATNTALVVTLLSLALACCASTEGPYWAAAIDIGSEDAGTASGILNSVGNAGGLLAPVLTPFIAARLGWAWGLYAAGIIILAGAATWWFVTSHDKPRALAT